MDQRDNGGGKLPSISTRAFDGKNGCKGCFSITGNDSMFYAADDVPLLYENATLNYIKNKATPI